MAIVERSEVVVGDDVTLHVNQSGQPDLDAVLWLHGSGPGVTGASNWDHMLELLGEDFHNIAPDLVGYGESTHPDPPPQGVKAFTELRVAALIGLLDQLDVQKVHLVGNSMGGIVALTLVQEYPERVGKIVLMGSSGAPGRMTPELLKLIKFYDDPTSAAMTELMRCFVFDPAVFIDDLEQIAEARMPLALREDVKRSHLATFTRGEPPPLSPAHLATITNEVLVVHGDDDRLVPVAHTAYFIDNLPNATLRTFEKTGHWLQIERPESFADTIRPFCHGEPVPTL